MRRQYFLGIDLGSSSVKASLVDAETGKCAATTFYPEHEAPIIHEGYIAQNMEKKGMIADRCEINRQIRADNKMLRELKAKVAKLAEAVEKSIPIIAETLEAIRNHMIFTQYHLLHNEMQKK